MAILEEQIREDYGFETENEMEVEAEIKDAEEDQALVAGALGGGLDHQTLQRYDMMAHHLSHGIATEKLAQAEHKIATQWDPLHMEYRHDETALRAIESIKGHVLAPVMQKKTTEARQALEERATELMQAGIAGQGASRDEIKDQFCDDVSMAVCGAAYHPVAVEVFEQLVAPVAKVADAPAPVVEEAQEEKAQEQIQEEEQKESA